MAHYSFLNHKNKVIKVITGVDESDDGIDYEIFYQNMFNLRCKRTSYNTKGGVHKLGGIPFRKNYARIGYIYDNSRDAFIPPQPFLSWTLNEETCQWEPPTEKPTDNVYVWNESNNAWELS